MAKKKSTKSQAIRDYLKANPTAKAKDVVEALKAKGIKVSANQVYFLMGAAKSKKQRKIKRQARTDKAAAVMTSKGDVVTLIQEVRTLAQKVGGYGKLKELADAL